MAVKASLKITLKANNIVVAESSNPAVWQQALALIAGPGKLPLHVPGRGNAIKADGLLKTAEKVLSRKAAVKAPADAIELFAADLSLDLAQVRAACNPTTDPPYLNLELRAWEDLKRQTPPRGYNSVPQIVLATTLLTLWFRRNELGQVTIQQGQAILRTIGLRDKNPLRGLNHCAWLQVKDETVKLKPAKLAQALAVARAFCGHQPIEERAPQEKS